MAEPKTVKLTCGHETGVQPVAVHPDGRKIYVCPKGCGVKYGGRKR